VELAECSTGVEPLDADESGPAGNDTVEEDDNADENVDEDVDDEADDNDEEEDEDDEAVGSGPFKGLPSVMLKPDFFALAPAADAEAADAVEPGVLRCKSSSAVARTIARLCSTDVACSCCCCCCCSMVAIGETCCCCCGGDGRGNRSGELQV